MSDIDLDELREALAKATPGPWALKEIKDWGVSFEVVGGFNETICCDTHYYPTAVIIENARLIAMAPTLAAAYLAKCEEVEALRQDAGRVAAILEETIRWHDEDNPDEYGVENAFLMREWFDDEDRAALAALRARLGEGE